MPQDFFDLQHDEPLLLPADMREWLPEDDLTFAVLDAVATIGLSEFSPRHRPVAMRAAGQGAGPAPRHGYIK